MPILPALPLKVLDAISLLNPQRKSWVLRLNSKFTLPVLHSPLTGCVCCSHSTKWDSFQLSLSPNTHPARSKSFPHLNYLSPPCLCPLFLFLHATLAPAKDSLGQKTKSFHNSTNVEASLGRKWETSSPSLLLPAAESMEVIIFLAQDVKGSGKSSFVEELLQPDIMDWNNENRAGLWEPMWDYLRQDKVILIIAIASGLWIKKGTPVVRVLERISAEGAGHRLRQLPQLRVMKSHLQGWTWITGDPIWIPQTVFSHKGMRLMGLRDLKWSFLSTQETSDLSWGNGDPLGQGSHSQGIRRGSCGSSCSFNSQPWSPRLRHQLLLYWHHCWTNKSLGLSCPGLSCQ